MIVSCRNYSIELPRYGIRLPIHKDRANTAIEQLLRHPELAKTSSHWLREVEPKTYDYQLFRNTHSQRYMDALMNPKVFAEVARAYDLYDYAGKINQSRFQAQSESLSFYELVEKVFLGKHVVLQAAELALREQFVYLLWSYAGGHHAMHDYGQGFCLVNDIVFASRYLQGQKLAEKIWIIDVDAHKGDGTAAITKGDPSITTLSIHMAKGWPLDNRQNEDSFIPSDIDTGVAQGEDAIYESLLHRGLDKLSQQFGKADFAIVVNGADPWEHDELPSASLLKLTKEQMLSRDQLVYQFLQTHQVPSLWLMAGGYGARVWEIYHQFVEWQLLSTKR